MLILLPSPLSPGNSLAFISAYVNFLQSVPAEVSGVTGAVLQSVAQLGVAFLIAIQNTIQIAYPQDPTSPYSLPSAKGYKVSLSSHVFPFQHRADLFSRVVCFPFSTASSSPPSYASSKLDSLSRSSRPLPLHPLSRKLPRTVTSRETFQKSLSKPWTRLVSIYFSTFGCLLTYFLTTPRHNRS